MSKITINQKTDILGIIDASPTFMPGGELAVPGGDEVVPVINKVLKSFRDAFATEDWHPKNHMSFASNHEGKAPMETVQMPYGEQILWPDHGIQNSVGAKTHADIDQSKVQVIIRKGYRPEIDSYSGFFENDQKTTTGLDAYLKARSKARIFLTGLATDFCVAYTAADGIKLGYEVYVLEDACRGIGIPLEGGGNTITAAKADLMEKGVKFITTDNIAA